MLGACKKVMRGEGKGKYRGGRRGYTKVVVERVEIVESIIEEEEKN